MSKAVCTLLGFALGASVGSIGAYVLMRNKFNDHIEHVCDEYDSYIDAMEHEQEKRCANCQQTVKESIVEDEDVDDISDEEAQELIDKLNDSFNVDEPIENESVDDLKDDTGVVSYDKMNKSAKKKESKKGSKKHTDEDTSEDNIDESVIFTISPEEYWDECKEYEKLPLTYLEGSDVFLTDDNEKYAALSAIGGKDTLGEMGKYEDGMLYVRNVALEIDFSIVFDIRDYDTYIDETNGN